MSTRFIGFQPCRNKWRSFHFPRLFLLLAAFINPSLHAQTYSSSMTGVVTDPSNAVVPNAAVSLTDVGKGFLFKATTDATGRYVIRNLPPSAYRLSVEAQGFQRYTQEGITLDVQQNAVVDVKLVLGSTAQTVEVRAAAPVLATQDAVTGQEVDRTLMNDLPLIGRSAYDLAFLAPGVTQPALGTASIPVLTSIEGSSGSNFISNGEGTSRAISCWTASPPRPTIIR